MLDQGVYTLAEVAQYTHMKARTLQTWFNPRADGTGLGPIFKSDYARQGDDFAVSFFNLIEAFVAFHSPGAGIASAPRPRSMARAIARV